MARRKRRFVLPVLPALGLAAVAAPALHIVNASAKSSESMSEHRSGDGGDDEAGDHESEHDGKKPKKTHPQGSAANSPSSTTTTAKAAPQSTPSNAPSSTPTTAAPTTTTAAPTTTTAAPTTTTAKPTTTTTAAPTTTTAKPTTTTTAKPTTTTAAPTTTTTAPPPPSSPLTVSEQFTQLVNGKPMLLALSVNNSSASQRTFSIRVEVKGTSAPPGFLNVNSDGTQTTLNNWSCSPAEIQSPTTDSIFNCNVTIQANKTDTVMVTTGSSFKASGNTINITSNVTNDNGSTTTLPAPASATGTVA